MEILRSNIPNPTPGVQGKKTGECSFWVHCSMPAECHTQVWSFSSFPSSLSLPQSPQGLGLRKDVTKRPLTEVHQSAGFLLPMRLYRRLQSPSRHVQSPSFASTSLSKESKLLVNNK